jgi:hypothetical protein
VAEAILAAQVHRKAAKVPSNHLAVRQGMTEAAAAAIQPTLLRTAHGRPAMIRMVVVVEVINGHRQQELAGVKVYPVVRDRIDNTYLMRLKMCESGAVASDFGFIAIGVGNIMITLLLLRDNCA